MGPIQVVVQDGNNLVLEVTPTPNTTVILDRGIAGPVGPMGDGDVDGPASSTDNAVARFDGTTGKLIQNSNVTIDDTGNLTYSAGTANGVAYLNGSKVLTTGSALRFDGTALRNTSGQFEGIDNMTLSALVSGTNATVLTLNSAGTAGTTRFQINNSERMRLTSTGLGIGTTSPAYRLDVTGTINSGASTATGYNHVFRTSGITTGRAQTSLTNTSGDFWTGIEGSTAGDTLTGSAAYSAFAGTFTANPLYLVTNSSIRATLDSSGNLGLGVTPSASTIPQFQSTFGIFSGNSEAHIARNATFNSGWKYVATSTAVRYAVGEGGGADFRWYQAASGTAGAAITFTQAMTLDANGNLLVGATSASASKLRVSVGGSAAGVRVDGITGSNQDFYALRNGASTIQDGPNITLQSASGTTYATTMQMGPTGETLFFNYNGSAWNERARIDSSGNFIQSAPSTAPSLATNGQMVFNLTSNTNLRVSVRGSDGVTRTANITLA